MPLRAVVAQTPTKHRPGWVLGGFGGVLAVFGVVSLEEWGSRASTHAYLYSNSSQEQAAPAFRGT